jgi:hypothetical protein
MRSTHLTWTSLLLLMTWFVSLAYASEPWKVAGAGNLTCKDWRTAQPAQQKEIFSWMLGFASAVNVANASKGVARVPLDQFTDDYLTKKIDSVCTDNSNQNVDMVVVVFRLLGAQPLVR